MTIFNSYVKLPEGILLKMDGLPIKNDDFPWRTVSHNQMVLAIISYPLVINISPVNQLPMAPAPPSAESPPLRHLAAKPASPSVLNVIYTFDGVLISVCNMWIIPYLYSYISAISIYVCISVCNIRILSWCMYIYTCIQYLYIIYNNPGVNRIWEVILPKSWQK